ncbi:fumarylacetoacetate hydrolase family protein [Ramlibacter sp. G-1-2-2]|uniref:Fumarylacetoacetate hydrolase family protein n=1 Tax=Ramlibacter agri TaxID=2728837 RepID=A0A848HCM6_9BURK|nr:fumarylacetoacetate hydrolase family protein [Ramlibacter agri]NML46283.1 fumarylacetoacetate hydrolase family protein [Ramlibacter agri]
MNEFLAATLPADAQQATLVGRVWVEGQGAVLVKVEGDQLVDLSKLAPTCSALLELPDAAAAVRAHQGARIAPLAKVIANSHADKRVDDTPYLLAPCDLQAIKAAGVTFVASMLERVIEEQARGNPALAESVRKEVVAVIGDDLSRVRPGSPDADKLKEVLVARKLWSQYLEVGIGPDAEIFTKSQPMSAVGTGAEIGIHPKSEWNNPEPEIVLAVNGRGETVGATLGNDVNLRDFEGRSALLLGKAKDNNASCAIGPFLRLFDAHFTIDDVRQCELAMKVVGPEGFVMEGSSSLGRISRDPLDLVAQGIGANHQYPDGFVLFLGTMFAPTQDRHGPGQGFTHAVGDLVAIATPRLGTLANRVNHSDRVAPWRYGAGALMRDLARRGLL